ncbi:IS701 family transposase [Streptomyces pratensis]|nr:IS701 family transposase [Streptomyces pratensis]
MEAVFAELAADHAPVYRRRDLRANGVLYLRGLLMPGVAGNCWSIAEAVGLDRPYRLHHLLERARWEEDTARDVVRAFLTRHLGADGGVLIFDERGQAKKGTKTAAVGRQYSGTMGRVENVIVAVYTTYATKRGHALIDRDLYVQADWFDDPARMATAGFPEDHAFATKPALALAQAKRALTAGIRPQWATGDEVYGRSRELREFLEAAGIGYVFAVPVNHQLTTSGGGRMRADQALHLIEQDGWNRRSCGAGAKGPRYYDWAWIATDHPHRWLLIRRSIADRARSRTSTPTPRRPSLPPDRPGQDCRDEMEGGGRLPGLEIHCLARPDPGQALPSVETPRHHGHGGPRRARGHRQNQPPRPHPARRCRPGPACRLRRDRADRPRGPATVSPAHHTSPRPTAAGQARPDRPASELVRLVKTPPGPSPLAPLPNPTRPL